MIKFDRIKLQTKAKYIYDLNPDLVKTSRVNKTNIESFMIKQNTPFNLFIQLNPSEDKGIIEFSSKILLDDYPKLITWNTIYQCLDNICKMGVCRLEIDDIINDSDIISCDITQDLNGIHLSSNFKQILLAYLRHLSKYHIQKYGSSGYTIIKDVSTDSSKVRLIIYDKHKEILKATNRDFINKLENPSSLLNHFINTYRIETNLRTFDQIRKYCETENNSLVSVLNSKANPLLKIFDIVFAEDFSQGNIPINNTSSIFDYTSMDQLRIALVLKECNNDLTKVDALLRGIYSEKSNFRKIMKPYKKFIISLPDQSENRLMIGQIRDRLAVC